MTNILSSPDKDGAMAKRELFKKWFGHLFPELPGQKPSSTCSCAGSTDTSCPSSEEVELNRRQALTTMAGFLGGATLTLAAPNLNGATTEEEKSLRFDEYFRKNYREMSQQEKMQTIERLERLSQIKYGVNAQISSQEAKKNVLFGYAFNISKCKGYMECVSACVKENNQDRNSNLQYITIHEMENGNMQLHSSNKQIVHEVPLDGHFYMGTQCFHCENPPCTKVCPVGATWKEEDGIVVVDYDWCIGCRYCEAACPYFGRRFNWAEPQIPKEEMNPTQHYLGNRPRSKGVMEKCTFCIQRSRDGKNPACVEACPTGARVFGNLLDPNSEIRYILENKKVFRLKEELGTEPKFWYYMDG